MLSILSYHYYYFITILTALYVVAFMFFLSPRLSYSKVSKSFALFLISVLLWSVKDSLGTMVIPLLSHSQNVKFLAFSSVFFLIVPACSFDVFMSICMAATAKTRISPKYLKYGRLIAFGVVGINYLLTIHNPEFMYRELTTFDHFYVFKPGPGIYLSILVTLVFSFFPSVYLVLISFRNMRSEAFFFGLGSVISEILIITTNSYPGAIGTHYRLGCASIGIFCAFCFFGIKKYGRAFSLAEVLDERNKLETIGKSLQRLLDIQNQDDIYQSICDYAREISDSAAVMLFFFKETPPLQKAYVHSISMQAKGEEKLYFLKRTTELDLMTSNDSFTRLQSGNSIECESLLELFGGFKAKDYQYAVSSLGIAQIICYPFTHEGIVRGAVCLLKHSRTINVDLYSIIAVQCSLVLKYSAQIKTIQEKRQLELQLQHSRKLEAVGQLAGGIAHDFNNMLAGINGYAGIIKRKFGTENPAIGKYADVISTAVERSSDLVKQLLAFARKGNYSSVNFDLHESITEVVRLLEHTIDKRIIIDCNLNAQNAHITGDPSHINNAIVNVALNARDAMPNGGSLLFETCNEFAASNDQVKSDLTEGEYVILKVTDTGIGISEEDLPRIFEPFFTTKDVGKGSGLGLASVYGIVKEHRGTIKVSSCLGKGTTLSMYLPVSLNPSVQIHDNSQDVFITGKGTVLLVDDEQLVREMASDLLRDLGYAVFTCPDGAKAVEIYQENWRCIDIVVLDLMMPVMDGYDCYDELIKINPEVKVIVCSGHSTKKKKLNSEKGAVYFMHKPYVASELSRAVASVMKKESSASTLPTSEDDL